MDATPLLINCDHHGRCVAAAVCAHLVSNNGKPLGFVENNSDPDDLQAWCFACEFVFLREQDKTENFRKFCDHVMVCSKCYEDIRLAHSVAI
jgi:hypothetical protein